MALAHFEREGCMHPYFINIDDDDFRTERIMWILDTEGDKIVGRGGNISPASISIVAEHCSLSRTAEKVKVTALKGPTYVNGQTVEANTTRVLQPWDRLAVGNLAYRFEWPGHEPEGQPMSAYEVMREMVQATMLVSNEVATAMFEALDHG